MSVEETLSAYGIRSVPTNERVENIPPDLVTRFRGRAVRRARKLNEQRLVPFYRWDVRPENGRWSVVALQNKASLR